MRYFHYYKEIIKQYSLVSNGGIVSALNLFSIKFDQVVDLVKNAENDHDYVATHKLGTQNKLFFILTKH